MRRSRQRQGETHHEDDVREFLRGGSGEVQKYILSKVAVSCEGEQVEKTRRGIPPPDLYHPPWDNRLVRKLLVKGF